MLEKAQWKPIESAPKDGTVIDLWMIDERGNQWREADAYYVRERAVDPYDTRKGKRDGWFAPNHDYEGQDGWCDEPRHFNDHPLQNRWIFTEPTHWMPLPDAPEMTLPQEPIHASS